MTSFSCGCALTTASCRRAIGSEGAPIEPRIYVKFQERLRARLLREFRILELDASRSSPEEEAAVAGLLGWR